MSRIKDWPAADRPREKLLHGGPALLSDAELLALILRTGDCRSRFTALDLARHLLAHFGSLRRLTEASTTELCRLPGIGPAKAAEVMAVGELARRFATTTLQPGARYTRSDDVFRHFHERLRDRRKEVFLALLLDANAGRTRDAVLAGIDRLPSTPAAFLTTSLAEPADPAGVPEPVTGRFGIRVCALDPVSGQLLWEWQALYPPPEAEVRTIPAVPALLDSDGDTLADAVVFGDLAGRLWVIDAVTGQSWGDGPAYQVEDGGSQPIGAGITVRGRLVVFGTGGAEHANPTGHYAIYGVEILPTGAQLRWTYPLAPGEQVWSAPVIDRLGRIYFAASQNYHPDDPAAWDRSTGRLVILDRDGRELANTPTDSAVAGRVKVALGTALAVTLSGQVYQFGAVRRQPAGQDSWQGALRLFSWRVR